MEATKNICYAVDHSTLSKLLNKYCPGGKNFDYQARTGRHKTVDSEAVLQVGQVALREYQVSLASPS